MPYALPKGVPALQADPRVTRRWMIAAIGGSILATATGTYLLCRGDRADRTAPKPPAAPPPAAPRVVDEDLQWALGVVQGPISELRRLEYVFLGVVERNPREADLWRGVDRLAEDAFADDEQALVLARRLHQLLSLKVAPERFTELRERLAKRIQGSRRGR